MKIYVGIDIGKLGAVVCIDSNSNVQTYPMPKVGDEIDQQRLSDIFFDIKRTNSEVVVVMEDVHSLHKAGAKSNFQFGRSLGIVEGMVVANSLPFYKVSPKTWQKVCFEGIPLMKLSGPFVEGRGVYDNKAMARLAAQRLYPTQDLRKSARAKVPDSGIVDALLMAHYCKLKY
jgi:crossover junction endodeoxyribonuclease RuvC